MEGPVLKVHRLRYGEDILLKDETEESVFVLLDLAGFFYRLINC